MLENLEEVDWAALNHAYGSAVDVPDLIRAYANGQDDHDLLYGRLCHQGTVYSATAAAVPFFLELLEAGDSSLLPFLHQCAICPENTPAARATRKQIAKALPIMRKLLRNKRKDLRLVAGHALAACAELIPEARNLLRDRIRNEKDKLVRAALMLSLMKANVANAGEILARACESEKSRLIRLTAGVALCNLAPEKLPGNVAHQMALALRKENPGLSDQYRAASDGNDLEQDIALALGKVPAGRADSAIPVLLEAWQESPGFYEAALAAITLAFPKTKARFAGDQLRPAQERVVRALISDEAIWRFCGDTAPLLASRGLPRDRNAMRRLLEDVTE
jgi:hypothetical protein